MGNTCKPASLCMPTNEEDEHSIDLGLSKGQNSGESMLTDCCNLSYTGPLNRNHTCGLLGLKVVVTWCALQSVCKAFPAETIIVGRCDHCSTKA